MKANRPAESALCEMKNSNMGRLNLIIIFF